MLANDIILDLFKRISQVVDSVLKGTSDNDLAYRPTKEANTIAWLIWHLSRIQDDHIATLAGDEQIWEQGWYEKFNLSFSRSATGYGQTPAEVAQVRASTELLAGYFDAVNQATIKYVKTLKPEDFAKVVDKHWDPPVTLSVRIVSVITDNLQHAGQAAYLKGIALKS